MPEDFREQRQAGASCFVPLLTLASFCLQVLSILFFPRVVVNDSLWSMRAAGGMRMPKSGSLESMGCGDLHRRPAVKIWCFCWSLLEWFVRVRVSARPVSSSFAGGVCYGQAKLLAAGLSRVGAAAQRSHQWTKMVKRIAVTGAHAGRRAGSRAIAAGMGD